MSQVYGFLPHSTCQGLLTQSLLSIHEQKWRLGLGKIQEPCHLRPYNTSTQWALHLHLDCKVRHTDTQMIWSGHYINLIRYDEEDDRMKAIMAGDDPGNLGVKEIDQESTSSSSLDVSSLCNPNSSPKLEPSEPDHSFSTCSSAAVIQCRTHSSTFS